MPTRPFVVPKAAAGSSSPCWGRSWTCGASRGGCPRSSSRACPPAAGSPLTPGPRETALPMGARGAPAGREVTGTPLPAPTSAAARAHRSQAGLPGDPRAGGPQGGVWALPRAGPTAGAARPQRRSGPWGASCWARGPAFQKPAGVGGRGLLQGPLSLVGRGRLGVLMPGGPRRVGR